MVTISYEPLHNSERRGVRHGGLSQSKLFCLVCALIVFFWLLYSHHSISNKLDAATSIVEEQARNLDASKKQIKNLRIELETAKQENKTLRDEQLKNEKDLNTFKTQNLDQQSKLASADKIKSDIENKWRLDKLELDKNRAMIDAKDQELRKCQRTLEEKNRPIVAEPEINQEKIKEEALVPKGINDAANLPLADDNESANNVGNAPVNHENEGLLVNDKPQEN
uniref:Golgi membrane protein 1 n=1 Tax=Rhabditophanes sp. KR3021 TaxID=114890 RepID=A0AC35TGZ2_9BILA